MSNSSSPEPRSGGPTPRRTITPAQKLDHFAAYEAAILRNEGGAYLREQEIYSSQITEWRKLRDAAVLAGKKPGEKVGRLTPEQAEIAAGTLRTPTGDDGNGARDNVKNARALGNSFEELAGRNTAHETMMTTCRELNRVVFDGG